MTVFRWGEKPGSGNSSANPPSREKMFFASGSVDENYVINIAKASTPGVQVTPQGILYRQDIKVNWDYAAHATVTVSYGPTNKEAGTFKIGYSTGGGTVHITASHETVARYPGDAADFKQTIGVNGDEVDGTDIVVPALKLNASGIYPAGFMNMARIKEIARSTGMVNSDPFLTFDPGEVLLLGANGDEGSFTEVPGSVEFACAENAVGAKKFDIGDIVNIEKQGHDYCWIRFKDDVDAGLRPVKVAKAAYVERVYKRRSFADLFGFQ